MLRIEITENKSGSVPVGARSCYEKTCGRFQIEGNPKIPETLKREEKSEAREAYKQFRFCSHPNE